MRLAIMQPYFFPYVGYFQLINAVDKFVIYDNIQFTKKGWINRNRILNNGRDSLFSLPLKKGSDYLNINERRLSDQFDIFEKDKLLRRIKEVYKKAPYYDDTINLIERVFNYQEKNLFKFIYFSIKEVVKHLEITTELLVSSDINIDHNLKSQE